MSAFEVAVAYDAHLPLSATGVEAVVRIAASDVGATAVDVALRLWTPIGSTVAVLSEVSPAIRDLRDAAVRLDDRTTEYPAGRWAGGAREYELALRVPARDAGDEMLAACVVVAAGGDVVGRAPIAVTWSGDVALPAPSARSAAQSTHATGTGTGAGSAAAAAELPTGPSPEPRHVHAEEPSAGDPCPGCGLRPADDDRFCEGCGHELVAGGTL